MKSLRFLIVEDHEFQRVMLEQTLRSMGAETIHGVANGRDAIRLLRSLPGEVDVVITDLMMPEVDGIELLPMLRKIAPGVAVVLSSALESSLPVAEAIARGHGLALLGAIEKPITPAKLRPLLDRCLAGGEGGAGGEQP